MPAISSHVLVDLPGNKTESTAPATTDDYDDDDDDPIAMSYSKIMRYSTAPVAAPLACEENIYEDVQCLDRTSYEKLLLVPADNLTQSLESLPKNHAMRPKKRQAPPPPLPPPPAGPMSILSASIESIVSNASSSHEKSSRRNMLHFIPDMLKK